MTIKEAIKNCELFTQTYDLFSSDMAAIETLIEAAEKQFKYRWHDLQKDPDDLPTKDEPVIVFCWNDHGTGQYTYKITRKNDLILYRWKYPYPFRLKAIAWKYIEPFEENTDGGKVVREVLDGDL